MFYKRDAMDPFLQDWEAQMHPDGVATKGGKGALIKRLADRVDIRTLDGSYGVDVVNSIGVFSCASQD